MSKAPLTDILDDKFYSKLGIPLSSITTAVSAIEHNRRTKNVVCLVGEAGIGKSQIVRQVATRRKPSTPFTWKGQQWSDAVPVHIMYLAHMLGEDISVPYPTRVKLQDLLDRADKLRLLAEFATAQGRTTLTETLTKQAFEAIEEATTMTNAQVVNGTVEYLINKELKDLPPEGILFLDEWNRADKSVIKTFFTLIEDNAVHGVRVIPDGVQIVAAMNPSDGAYSVNEAEKDPAFRRRLSFIAITTNVNTWLTYAEGPGNFHKLVTEYVKSCPDQLYDVKLRAANKQFPCPASWEKVSHILHEADRTKVKIADDLGIHACIQGHIGDAPANTFIDYIRDHQTVISPTEILEGYTEKSSVRKKISHLVTTGRNDVLNEVCTSVALALWHTKPDIEKVVGFLALFLYDLQPEMAMSFIVHKITNAMEGVNKADEYLTQLSSALHAQPRYREMFERINAASQKASNTLTL